MDNNDQVDWGILFRAAMITTLWSLVWILGIVILVGIISFIPPEMFFSVLFIATLLLFWFLGVADRYDKMMKGK